MTKLIEAKKLQTNFYTYEGVVKALNNVDLTITHGTTFGLVGESGCGKSVFVRSIMRIIQAPGRIDGGEIFFYPEKDTKNPTELLAQSESFMENLRGNHISMIFQEPNAALNPIMTIGDQVAESFLFHRKKEMCQKIYQDLEANGSSTLPFLKPLYKTIYRRAAENPEALFLKILSKIPILKRWDKKLKKEAIRRSSEIISHLSIPNPDEVVKLYPHNLSGGMKQRIVIAIALACHPVLLIADEATSNLDVTIQAQILELIRELKKKEISSVLLITHDLGIVAETCDRVAVMYAGNVCEEADVKELFSKPFHPYTKALLNSVPKFAQVDKLQTIDGTVPNLVTPPPGCRFHPRCKKAMDICSQELPPTIEVEKNHTVACHLWNK